MAEQKPENNSNLTAFYKVNDWYSKHNFGTRISLLVFLGMYILVVGTTVDYSVFTSTDLNSTQPIVETIKNNVDSSKIELVKVIGYFAFAAFTIVTLGDNALTKIGDIIVRVKGGKKDNSIIK